MALHLGSLWKRDFGQIGNALLSLWAKSYGAGIEMKPIYLVKRLQGTIYFLRFYKTKFNFGGILLARRLEVKRFNMASLSQGLERSER